jgi:hypothetical protein
MWPVYKIIPIVPINRGLKNLVSCFRIKECSDSLGYSGTSLFINQTINSSNIWDWFEWIQHIGRPIRDPVIRC